MYAIPYDLDSSGLVDASYAAPPDRLPVRNVRQRLYRGFCFHNDEIAEALERYRDKKEEILALFNDEELLTKRDRSTALRYLEGFYDLLETPGDVKKHLLDKCRG